MALPLGDEESLDKLLEEYIKSMDSPITIPSLGEEGQNLLEEMLGNHTTTFDGEKGQECINYKPSYDLADDSFFPDSIESLFQMDPLGGQDSILEFGWSQEGGSSSDPKLTLVKEFDVGKQISMGGESSTILPPQHGSQTAPPPPQASSPFIPPPLAPPNSTAPAGNNNMTNSAPADAAAKGKFPLAESAKLQAEEPEKADHQKMMKSRQSAYKAKERKRLVEGILQNDLQKVESEASQLASKVNSIEIDNTNLLAESARLREHRANLQSQLAHQDDILAAVKQKIAHVMAMAPTTVHSNGGNKPGIQALQAEVQQIQQLMAQFSAMQAAAPAANGNQQNFMAMANNDVQLSGQQQPGHLRQPPPQQGVDHQAMYLRLKEQFLLPSAQKQQNRHHFPAANNGASASSSLYPPPATRATAPLQFLSLAQNQQRGSFPVANNGASASAFAPPAPTYFSLGPPPKTTMAAAPPFQLLPSAQKSHFLAANNGASASASSAPAPAPTYFSLGPPPVTTTRAATPRQLIPSAQKSHFPTANNGASASAHAPFSFGSPPATTRPAAPFRLLPLAQKQQNPQFPAANNVASASSSASASASSSACPPPVATTTEAAAPLPQLTNHQQLPPPPPPAA